MTVNSHARPGEVQSVHRALDLLESVGHASESGVATLAEELGLATSTVHNLVRTLVRRGYLLRSGGRYRIGPGVTALVAAWNPVASLAEPVREALERIADETGHASASTILVGTQVRRLGYSPGRGLVTSTSPRDLARDALARPTGRVLVAMTRRNDWDEFITEMLDRDNTRWSMEQWRAELDEIARTGVSVRRAADADGQAAIAVPVWAHGGSIVCALGSSAPGFLATDELLEQMLTVLWRTAEELSQQFGCETMPLPKPSLPA